MVKERPTLPLGNGKSIIPKRIGKCRICNLQIWQGEIYERIDKRYYHRACLEQRKTVLD